MLDPVRLYDYLCTARQWVFDQSRPLTDEQYQRHFNIGLGSLARTLTHIMICEWLYAARIEGRAVPPYPQWPIRDEEPPPFATLESTWIPQAKQTRAILAAKRNWTAPIEYEVTNDKGRRIRVRTNAADIATQLILHEMHHRAQAMNQLRQLGIEAKEIDFNAFMYERTEIGA